MSSILGPYYSPTHYYPQDEDYIRRLDPAWVRIHQPTAKAIELVQRNAPNARIMLRSWDIDDNNGERKREMYGDPKGAARMHLGMWMRKRDELMTEALRNGWTLDDSKWHLGLVNEPDPAHVPQTVEYTLEAMRIVKGTTIRLGVVASSVGTYSKPSENDQGWTRFIPLEKPINDGGHILMAHEYWQPEGPNFGEDGGNLAWRHRIIPLDVPILIAESGANGYIYGRYSKDDDSGWQKTVKDPNVYAAQVKEYIEGCDHRVKGVLLYMLDFHSDQWWSFNTGPAMEQLLAIKDVRPQVPSPFATQPAPPPTSSGPTPAPQPAYVAVPAGANIRMTPISGDVLDSAPYGAQLALIGVDAESGWLRVEYNGFRGWMSPKLISTTPPAQPMPAPPVPPPSAVGATGIIDPLTALAFLEVESNNRAFEGGYLVLRFEVHRFKVNLGNDELFNRHFKFTPGNYNDQHWRPDANSPWIHAHGNQHERHKLLKFARSLNDSAALRSTGMGMAQIMGENHARVGYATPQAMFKAFSHPRYGVNAQVMGFVNYVLSDPGLLAAIKTSDFLEMTRRYNGIGQEAVYVPALQNALHLIQAEVGV